MKNPWFEYLSRSNRTNFHPEDEANALGFNASIEGRTSLILAEHLEPFPYLGNPKAPVIILLANPGMSDKEAKRTYKISKEKLKLSNDNLIHANNSNLSLTLKSGKRDLESPWFQARTRKLVEKTSIEAVAENLFFINFHAYHSKSWYPIPFTFHTQKYSFSLVRDGLDRGAHILMSRNTIGWLTAIPELHDYCRISIFRSSRSVHITSGNLGNTAFNKLIREISK